MSKQSTDANELVLKAGFDREMIFWKGDSVRYLVATVEAPTQPEHEQPDRVPLNIALVVDASGSMSGDRIECAKQAARELLNCLQDGDLLTLVSFDSTVTLHLPGIPLNAKTRQDAARAIDRMHAGSMTNLSGGWMQGAESLLEASEPGRTNRVILLTDGHANEGITDPQELAVLASDYREKGIYTSAVGIGDGYSPDQIEAIANHGGGTVHDAEFPHEIVEVLTAELQESFAIFADDLRLHVEHPSGVRCKAMGPYALNEQNDAQEVGLGSLVHGRSREVVLQFTLPAGELGEVLEFSVWATYRKPGMNEESRAVIPRQALEYARGSQLSSQPRDESRSLAVVTAWHGDVIRKALSIHRDGDWSGAASYVEQQLGHFLRYCRDLDGVDKEVGELKLLTSRLQRPMQARARREVELAMYHRASNRMDARIQRREAYEAHLFDGEDG